MKIFAVIVGTFLASLACVYVTVPVARGGSQSVSVDAPGTHPAQNVEMYDNNEQRYGTPVPEPQGLPRKVAVFMKGAEPRELKGAYSVLSSRLIAALADSRTYTAVDRTEDVKEILEKEIVYQQSGAVADDDIRKAGLQLGVQYVCIAMVSEVMGSYLLEVRLVDVESAEVVKLASKQSTVKNADQLMEAIENTVRVFMGGQNK